MEQLDGLTRGLTLLAGNVGNLPRALDLVGLQAEQLREWTGSGERRPPAEREGITHDAVVVDGDRDEGSTTAIAVAGDADADLPRPRAARAPRR